ncbi:stalk domain-containing protein [Paenibacillus koleovorans]|uniref:stalk domain-containing protein n=1 Tax=Paenibacillus koleovorans TaxID=121608 RepID=UPI000FDC2951|nr:stalk domain-containing protein [Paenibacillus koleovorans]
MSKFRKKAILACSALLLGAALVLPPGKPAQAEDSWTLHLRAEQHVKSGRTDLAVPIWDGLMRSAAANSDWLTAALYAGYIDEYYDAVHEYEKAVIYYELENEYWLRDGKDWGANDLQRAYQLRTTIEAYASTEQTEELQRPYLPASGQLAKFEPAYGVYIGIYSELDPAMGNHFDRSKSIFGKDHAMYLAYATYGEEFPKRYADNAKAAGSALQIAWQPLQGLQAVKDDAYLRQWALAAKEAGIPIFLRYACEMNGDWTPWVSDTQTYIEKFRIVANVMHELAPNVAVVWSPGDVPKYTMANYYPGDAYVDWVGVSLYTEPYSHGDPNVSMQASTPIEKLDELYKLYADRKPIMLSETAVSNHTNVDGKSHTEYALLNLERLYKIMPLKYPRLKAITYFNVDLRGRESQNSYSVSSNEQTMKLYKELIQDPFFLTHVQTGVTPSNGILYQDVWKPIRQQTTWVPFVRIPQVFFGKVEYVLNGRVMETKMAPPYELDVMAGDVPGGSNLEIRVYDKKGTMTASRTFPVTSQVSVTIDQADQSFEQPPVIINENTLTPLRAIFEKMGATVSWNPDTRTATGTKNGKTVSLSIGSKTAFVNGKPQQLEESAQLVNGYTMAPARFIGEVFGGEVVWDGRTRTVIITTK